MTRFDRFRDAVLADPAAQVALARCTDAGSFAREALAWAAAEGLPLDPGDLPTRTAPVERRAHPGRHWLPVAVDADHIEWLHFAGERPRRPFFEDDVQHARRHPFNWLFRHRTPRSILIDPTNGDPCEPDGFIFHLSRCGSTLAAQMLGAPDDWAAVSEAPPIDAVVRTPFAEPDQHARALRAIVAAYGHGLGRPARWFVKLDSWHTRALPLFAQAFPGVPWIFLHRDPVEVLVSHARMPGIHMIPQLVPPQLFGLATPAVPDTDYAARVLAAIAGAVVTHRSLGQGLAVDYSELPEALFTRILPHFGLLPSAGDTAAMRRAATRDAKAPVQGFVPDGAAKRQAATAEIRLSAERHLQDLRAALVTLGAG